MTSETHPNDRNPASTASADGSSSRAPTADREEGTHTVIRLAALLLLISGGFNIVVGVGFLADDVSATQLTPFAEIATWGGFLLLIGGAKIFSGIGLLARRFGAALIASVFVGFDLVAHMALLPSSPLRSAPLIVFDMLALGVLVVHGSQGR
jgi:hypothetical protein